MHANSAERYDAWYRSPRGEWIANAEFQLLVADQRQALREMLRVTRTRLVLGLLNHVSLLYL